MSFKAPKAPPPPPPVAPLPVETDPSVREKATAALKQASTRKGYGSTIMSGMLGDSAPAPASRTMLG